MNKLTVSSPSHIRMGTTTARIMLDVIIALLPTAVMGTVIFGLRALLVMFSCISASVLSEYLFNLITKKEQTVGDLSAVVTGLILALNLRADAPIWQCVIGAVFAIIVVKCLFGGLGTNFANPAATGRVFLLTCFAGSLAGGAMPKIAELATSATPLELMASGGYDKLPSMLDMFLGLRGGAIGEVCTAALIVGFLYLVIRRVIHFETPLIFIGTVFLLSLIITNDPVKAVYQVLGGGLVLAAVFMVTDYASTPITRSGRMIFAFGTGLITVLIRFYGSYPEGVSFAILLMNILSPYIEKWTQRRPFGGKKV